MVSKEIIENFPYKKPRKEQLELIDKIYEAFESYDYVVLEAGTGIGKSGIAATLAKIYNSAYILTMTKQLQKQYFHDFRFPIVKGRNNFKCKINKNLTCDEGPCRILKLNCPHDPLDKKELDNLKSELNTSDAKKIQMYMDEDICDYRKQVYIGYISNITILNYQYAIMAFNYTRFFDKRYLMVFDEAHNIEDIVMKHVSYTLNNQLLYKDIGERLPNYKNLEKWIDYIAYILEKYKKRLKKLKKQIKNNQNDELLRKTVRMEKRIKKLEILNKNIRKNPDNWIIDIYENKVVFKPIYVSENTSDLLFKGNKHLFMSATIIDVNQFCKDIGIDPKECYYLKKESPFEKEKRPIVLKLAGRLSKRYKKITMPRTIPILKKILKKHEDEKGLIHTNSYEFQKYIIRNINNPRLIYHNNRNREEILYKFKRSKEPLVLVSPSMGEGVDLPYENCTFQVIYKIPFPYLGDKQVRIRAERDPNWYAYKTVMTLVQEYGRGMRAKDDWCVTYILDSSINTILNAKDYRKIVPKYFREAIQKKFI